MKDRLLTRAKNMTSKVGFCPVIEDNQALAIKRHHTIVKTQKFNSDYKQTNGLDIFDQSLDDNAIEQSQTTQNNEQRLGWRSQLLKYKFINKERVQLQRALQNTLIQNNKLREYCIELQLKWGDQLCEQRKTKSL